MAIIHRPLRALVSFRPNILQVFPIIAKSRRMCLQEHIRLRTRIATDIGPSSVRQSPISMETAVGVRINAKMSYIPIWMRMVNPFFVLLQI